MRTVKAIANESAPEKEQPEGAQGKSAPKIFKDDCRINWQWSLADLHNFIRGLSPYPGAWTTFNGKQLKIFKTEKIPADHEQPTGKAITDQRSYLHVAVNGGYLALLEIQVAGRQKMTVTQFLNGFTIPEDFVFDNPT